MCLLFTCGCGSCTPDLAVSGLIHPGHTHCRGGWDMLFRHSHQNVCTWRGGMADYIFLYFMNTQNSPLYIIDSNVVWWCSSWLFPFKTCTLTSKQKKGKKQEWERWKGRYGNAYVRSCVLQAPYIIYIWSLYIYYNIPIESFLSTQTGICEYWQPQIWTAR